MTWYIKLLLLLLSHFSRVRLLATPWTAAYQAPPSMGFSRQEYWSGLPLPSPLKIWVLENLQKYMGIWRVMFLHSWSQWLSYQFSSVHFSRSVMSPWTASRPASLSITNSWSSPKPMSTESVMPSSYLILCLPLLLLPSIFPSIRVFQMSQLFISGGQSTGVSASTWVFPMNTQDWSPLGWSGWIFFQSKGLSRVFSSTIVQKHQFFGAQLSL